MQHTLYQMNTLDPRYCGQQVMASIIFIRGGQTTRHTLGETDVSIGRHVDADIRLEQDHVSRGHARIFRSKGAWWLEDMNSTGGTTVNEKKSAA